MKKVLVGCPTSDYHEYALKEYSQAVKQLTYKNHEVLLVDNSKNSNYRKKIESFGLKVKKCEYSDSARTRIVNSMNLLREKVLKEKYDYLLSLEQDIIPPTNVIESLLSHKKDIVSGLYFVYQNQYSNEQKRYLIPVAWISDNEFSPGNLDGASVRVLHPREAEKGNLIRVVSCGTGCLLIDRKVLSKVEFRFEEFFPFFHDNWFCRDSFYQGFSIFLDTSVKCKHLINQKPWKWSELKK